MQRAHKLLVLGAHDIFASHYAPYSLRLNRQHIISIAISITILRHLDSQGGDRQPRTSKAENAHQTPSIQFSYLPTTHLYKEQSSNDPHQMMTSEIQDRYAPNQPKESSRSKAIARYIDANLVGDSGDLGIDWPRLDTLVCALEGAAV